MGRSRKKGRDISGVLLFDKPLGMSSNQALQRVRHLFSARKAGHTGSLDPLATGLLPLCLGEATKYSSYLLDADKHYNTVAHLGSRSTTGDAEGDKIDQRSVPPFDTAQLEEVLSGFTGESLQIPPMYSAIRQDGKRLYELARQGREVERPPRPIRIDRLLLTGHGDDRLHLSVSCSKGTYIRSLVEDIGEALGCGAYVEELRRTGVSPYIEPEMWTLEALAEKAETSEAELDACLIPVDTALSVFPELKLDEKQSLDMLHGRSVESGNVLGAGLYRLYDDENRFIGLGEVGDDSLVKPKRLISNG
jgi:tRNA pseudouridine55 synthase